MGALHLEVVIQRLLSQYGVTCHAGPKLVAFKERPLEEVALEHTMQRPIANVMQVLPVLLVCSAGSADSSSGRT